MLRLVVTVVVGGNPHSLPSDRKKAPGPVGRCRRNGGKTLAMSSFEGNEREESGQDGLAPTGESDLMGCPNPQGASASAAAISLIMPTVAAAMGRSHSQESGRTDDRAGAWRCQDAATERDPSMFLGVGISFLSVSPWGAERWREGSVRETLYIGNTGNQPANGVRWAAAR